MKRLRQYLRNLITQAQDLEFMVIELFLAWIAVALTVLCIGMLLYYIFPR